MRRKEKKENSFPIKLVNLNDRKNEHEYNKKGNKTMQVNNNNINK